MSRFEQDFKHPYAYDPKYKKRVAYFCMEFAIDQPFKIYSGGLGFLAGSHMRSAYELNQNFIGIGILWKYGYYDQVRKGNQEMDALFQEKINNFLEDTNIKFTIEVNGHPVWVTAKYLRPGVFNTVPMFFLTTDLPENDYLSQSISHRLYDADASAKVAQYMLLGLGGAKLLDELEYNAEVYHFNEAHALPASFHLAKKFNGDMQKVKELLVFTTHTPEEAGNEKHDIHFLNKLGYFNGMPLDEVRRITGIENDTFDHSLACLRLAKIANGVSKLHGEVSNDMWNKYDNICRITSITNAQNRTYWADEQLYTALHKEDDDKLLDRKRYLKSKLFETVADQTGKLMDPKVLTIVWARRFAAYKRADLVTRDKERFNRIMNNPDRPIQIIWAGKPYPMDYGAVSIFNQLVHLSKDYGNMAVLVGYELKLSRKLKQGSDVWLNNPRVPREASGTSGMTSAMNGGINLSTDDGWIPEFANGENSYVLPLADLNAPVHEQDEQDMNSLLDVLENEIIPTYYDRPEDWNERVKNSMRDVLPYFDANRMALQYYEKLYND
ncbi:alpha-glucan family phosphorylase [Flammeovirga pectinis]|uniref:Alpha-glucan family phosphorylase n=1 Tax=Flammeovirga pectinis TaxID=2494373 RepID=A0A3S9P4U3_9BACT|nr:alpha-glucan family phosphorylase [Flammeovirga pectinis]AZQ63178.1 alpha-glucan family phosphorylase [Flammeovirga pectinis]